MSIRVLDEFEHIRSRPGMYIGSTETPLHLLYELVDNAADECLNGYSKFMAVIMDLDQHIYSVTDQGRGIPTKAPNIDGEVPVVLATKLFSGGKFDNQLYAHRSGLHGVGLVAVNALSSEFIITTKDKKHHKRYTFHGKDVVMEKIEECKYSTLVSFQPDSTFFDTIDIDKDIIYNRLKSILVYDSSLDIFLIVTHKGQTTTTKIVNDIVDTFKNECTMCTEVSVKANKEKKDDLDLWVGFDSEVKTKKFQGIINTLVVNQGTHQVMIESAIKEYLFNKAQKLKMHVNRDDVILGCRVLAIMKLTDPAFSGQTKMGLDMKVADLEHIIVKEQIWKSLDAVPELTKNWLECAQAYRIAQDSKKNSNGNKKAKSLVMVHGLRDCVSLDVSERELFILEGESAGGTLLQARDVNKHAVLPLRGKITNVLNASTDKILNKDKTLASIFQAINVKMFNDDLSNIRYSKIVIMADADNDGKHIAALLLIMFDKLCPKLYEEGYVYVADTPLFGCWEGKKFVPIYTMEELEEWRDKKATIKRYKGLGEMMPDELYASAIAEDTRKLIQIYKPADAETTVADIYNNKARLIEEYLQV